VDAFSNNCSLFLDSNNSRGISAYIQDVVARDQLSTSDVRDSYASFRRIKSCSVDAEEDAADAAKALDGWTIVGIVVRKKSLESVSLLVVSRFGSVLDFVGML